MLFDVINSSISDMVIHHIGSHSDNSENVYSQRPMSFSEDDSELPHLLKQFFFDSFREPSLYCFEDMDDSVAKMVASVFDNPSSFYENSRLFAASLYENSNHPNIKSGELYVAMFRDVRIFDQDVRCLGLFKSEHKDTFLKVYNQEDGLALGYDEGLDLKKLDKGCLIFDIERDKGFVVALLDKAAGKSEATFWKNDFLGLVTRMDNNFQTKEYMDLCKSFVTDIFRPSREEEPENGIERADQIDMLNRQVDFFKGTDIFDIDRFKEQVLGNNESICDVFDEHLAHFEEANDLELPKTFAISKEVVKKGAPKFKSVLKLDKNFHVYIHGNRDMIERSFDKEKRMHYYKIYFENEE